MLAWLRATSLFRPRARRASPATKAPKSSACGGGRIKPACLPERKSGSNRVDRVSRENGAACQSQKCDCNFEHGRRPWLPASHTKPTRTCTVKDKPQRRDGFYMN